MPKAKKNLKLRDQKPQKDPKGGGGGGKHSVQGGGGKHNLQGHGKHAEN